MANQFEEISPLKIEENAFKLIGTDWMLITAGTPKSFNMMTASWGGLGVLWDRNVSWCFIRPIRHTYGFIERNEFYTFSFFEEKYRSVLDFCGEHSGRNIDKVAKTGITPVEGIHETVYFDEARLVITCKKLYTHALDKNNFIDHGIIQKFYRGGNLHRMYIGEVITCLLKK